MKIQKFLNFSLNLLLGGLSYIVPKNQKLVLCSGTKKFAGNPAFFLRYLEKNTKNYSFWIAKNRKNFKELKNAGIPVLYRLSLNCFFKILRAKYLIVSHDMGQIGYFYYLPGRFTQIQTWHGIGIKRDAKKSKEKLRNSKLDSLARKKYNLIVSSSAKQSRDHNLRFKNNNVRILGFPRNDIFFNKTLYLNDYKKKFKLEKYEKVFLYCPTVRKYGTRVFSKDFLNHLNDYLKQKNYVMLEKRHIRDKTKSKNYDDFSNIMFVTDDVEDIQDLLIHTDVLITDYSSIFADFCLTDNPIIFYPYDYDEFTSQYTLNIDYFNELPGPFARTEDELINIIKNISSISSEPKYQENYKILKNKYHFYQDGKSCERLYKYLFDN